MTFRYTARGEGGRTVKGTVKAISEVMAQNLLVEQGHTPLAIEPIASPWSMEGALPSMFGVKPNDVITFSRQLATLLDSGVSLLPALQLLESQATSSAAFGRIVRSVAQDIGMGRSFGAALGRHPTAFSEIYVRTISVGERTGKLQAILREMADYMEKQGAFAKKIGKALMMPMITLVIGLVVSGVIVTLVLPQLSGLFTSLNTALPPPTRILMATSAFMTKNIVYVLGGTVALTVAFIIFIKQPQGRRALDQFKLNAPVLGLPTRLSELARMCRTLAVLLNAGLSLQEVMDLLPQSTANSVVRDTLQRVRRGLLLGQGLTYPMSAEPLFPPLMLQMVRVGEESNTMENNLRVLATFYETTANDKTEAMVGMIMPLSTMGISAMVAFIALSVVMPMYSVSSAF